MICRGKEFCAPVLMYKFKCKRLICFQLCRDERRINGTAYVISVLMWLTRIFVKSIDSNDEIWILGYLEGYISCVTANWSDVLSCSCAARQNNGCDNRFNIFHHYL